MSIRPRDILIGVALLGAALASLEAIADRSSQRSELAMKVCQSCLNGEFGAIPHDPALMQVHTDIGDLTTHIEAAALRGQQDVLLRAPAQDDRTAN